MTHDLNPRFNTVLPNLIFAIAVGSAHFFLVGTFENADLTRISSFSVERPFVSRVLIPLVAGPFVKLIGIVPTYLFIEILFCFFLLRVFYHLFREASIPSSSASTLARFNLMFILIPFNTISEMRLFYPWDTPAAFFTLMAVLLSLRARPYLLLTLFGFALFNRETSFVIPLIYFLTAPGKNVLRTRVLVICGAMWLLGRTTLAAVFSDHPGVFLQLSSPYPPYDLTFFGNVDFILSNPFQFLASLAFLPALLLIVAFKGPQYQQKLLIPAGLLFLASLVAGFAIEPRAFSEFFVLSSYLVTVQLWNIWSRKDNQDQRTEATG